MRSAILWLLAASLCGCAYQLAQTPHLRNGWMVYAGDATTVRGTCGRLPILLTGSHTATRLAGDCRRIAVSGNHNDVTLGLAPGARITVTGAHNDIWWHRRGRGPLPRLIDRGSDNRFHFVS